MGGQMDTTTTGSRVTRVRHEPVRRDVEVIRIDEISPNFRSLTFAGEALANFRSDGFDDHVKLILPSGDGEVARDYTPRRFNPVSKELTIEFALHGHGFASNWAASARLGQRAVIAGPRGSMIVPTDYQWHLLIGDDTALPAVARRLEELPSGAVAQVLLLVTDRADRRRFKSKAVFNVNWADNEQELIDTVRAFHVPSGEGHIWCGAEAAIAAAVREILVERKGHDKDAIRSSAYWRRSKGDAA